MFENWPRLRTKLSYKRSKISGFFTGSVSQSVLSTVCFFCCRNIRNNREEEEDHPRGGLTNHRAGWIELRGGAKTGAKQISVERTRELAQPSIDLLLFYDFQILVKFVFTSVCIFVCMCVL